MYALFFTLLRILFPLDPVARLREVTRDYLGELLGYLEDPLGMHELQSSLDARACLEAEIIVAEHGVQLLIQERARQIAGLTFIYTPRMKMPVLHKAKPLAEILARFRQTILLFDNLERLAQRRAKLLLREREASPLRLDALHQSTSPALRAEEEKRQRSFIVRISSSAPQERGRWIGASSRRDGGGSHSSARGPPPDRRSESAHSRTSQPPARSPAYARSSKNPPASHDATPHPR